MSIIYYSLNNFGLKVVLAPNTTVSAPMNVPSPGQMLRKNRMPANIGGRKGTDFWNIVSFSLELIISHSTRFPSGSFIRMVLSVNLKDGHFYQSNLHKILSTCCSMACLLFFRSWTRIPMFARFDLDPRFSLLSLAPSVDRVPWA